MALRALAFAVLAGCGAAAPKVVDKIVTVPVKERCIEQPMPPHTPVPKPTQCVPGKLCRDVAAELAQVENTERLLEWARIQWERCRKEPDR